MEPLSFQTAGGGKCPARSAQTLVLDSSHVTLGAPVNGIRNIGVQWLQKHNTVRAVGCVALLVSIHHFNKFSRGLQIKNPWNRNAVTCSPQFWDKNVLARNYQISVFVHAKRESCFAKAVSNIVMLDFSQILLPNSPPHNLFGVGFIILSCNKLGL